VLRFQPVCVPIPVPVRVPATGRVQDTAAEVTRESPVAQKGVESFF
jgi:hypothetical protein